VAALIGARRRDGILARMCGRFTLTARDIDEAARAFGAEVEREHARLYRPRWNIAPTDAHWIVRLDGAGRRRMLPARFGMDGLDGALLINARSETAASLPTFRRACAEGRCVVPADGFYEWRGARSARQPLWFHDQGGRPLLFAGLAAPREGGLAFVILTTAANERMRPVHDRMPALLSPDGADAWLARGDLGLLAPAPEASLSLREVSQRVNSVANDGPELLDPPAPARQLTLL
jgi:putative SOS response-associated peptidase YedK